MSAFEALKTQPLMAVITDLDGTAVQSTLRIRTARNVLLEKFNLRVSADSLFDCAERSGSFAFPKLAGALQKKPRDGMPPEKREKHFSDLCLSAFSRVLKRTRGTKDLTALHFPAFAKILAEKSVPLIACTNAENEEIAMHTARLAEQASKQNFAAVYYSGMKDPLNPAVTLRKKPTPDMLLAAFEKVSRELSEDRRKELFDGPARPMILALGDQDADRQAAEAAREKLAAQGVDLYFVSLTGASMSRIVAKRTKELKKANMPHARNFGPLVKALQR